MTLSTADTLIDVHLEGRDAADANNPHCPHPPHSREWSVFWNSFNARLAELAAEQEVVRVRVEDGELDACEVQPQSFLSRMFSKFFRSE